MPPVAPRRGTPADIQSVGSYTLEGRRPYITKRLPIPREFAHEKVCQHRQMPEKLPLLLVLGFNRLNDSCRIASYHGQGRNVVRHHTVGSHDGPVANPHTGQYGGVDAKSSTKLPFLCRFYNFMGRFYKAKAARFSQKCVNLHPIVYLPTGDTL